MFWAVTVDYSRLRLLVAGAAVDPSFADAELEILFSQIRTHLSERERHILVLMKQDLGPRQISAALGITYDAASKAIQRVRDRVASLLAAPEARRKRGMK
jgi:DNA-directed RNA polymerase specialized sigma subunit